MARNNPLIQQLVIANTEMHLISDDIVQVSNGKELRGRV